MAYKYREEIVGKRFLSVSGFTKIKLGKITEWGWRSGVIRAASHKDNKHKDLQVLVEYDDVEWHRREWITIYKDSLFHFFLVEQALVWCDRRDPFSNSHQNVQWPALTFSALVSSVDLSSQAQPVEFLLDRELAFKDHSRLQPFQEWDAALPGVRDYPELRAEVRRWAELQDGQRILLTTPSVLVGYRVEVYRAEGTTQWYTAVIVGYNEATRDLTVTDDTVLEEHNEDPSLVQMRLIGDGVVESIMRGENVGITPRRSRSALLHSTHHHHPLVSSRSSRGITHSLPTSIARSHGNTAASVAHRKQRGARPSAAAATASAADVRSPTSPQNTSTPPLVTSPRDKDNSSEEINTKGGKTQRKRKSSENDVHTVTKPRQNSNSAYSNKEDLENKQGRKRNSYTRGAKKKVLEEANNSKLRHVQVRVEDCLQNGESLSNLCRQKTNESEKQKEEKVEEQQVKEQTSPQKQKSQPQLVEVEERDAISVDDSNSRIETPPVIVSGEESNNSRLEVPVIEDSNSSSVQLLEDVVVSETIIEECSRNKEEAISEEDDCVIVGESGPVKEESSVSVVRTEEVIGVRSEEELRISTNNSSGVGERINVDSGVVLVDGVEVPLSVEEDLTSGGVLLSGCDDDVPLSSSSPLFSRMELSDSSGPTSLLRFSDDRSDSGVSSLRSGSCASGDERSGSRSSALSSSDEPPQQQQQQQQQQPLLNHHQQSIQTSSTAVVCSTTAAVSSQGSIRRSSPHFVAASSSSASASASAAAEAVRVWRDPSLILEAEPHVRHIHSVQHQSLLMSHPAAASAASAPPSSTTTSTSSSSSSSSSLAAAVAAAAHYPSIPPVPVPPLMSSVGPLGPHHHPHGVPPPPHHLPPPGLYPQVAEMLWKPRYPLSVGPQHLLAPQASHPTAEELYERDRAYTQDRLRERRESEAREMEKAQHKKREEERERIERERERQEREKIDREREREKQAERDRLEREQEREKQEKQRQELAVHKHFEESLRLAHQKQFVDSLQRDRSHHPWNLFSLPHPQRPSSAAEEDRKRAEQEHHQREQQHRQLAVNERLRHDARERERQAYYAMTSQRSPNVSQKSEYPPPAHSRVSSANMKVNDKLSVGHTSLPKAEPNMSLFGGYPGYQPGFMPHDSKVVKMDHHKSSSQSNSGHIVNKSSAMIDRERELVLTNPPPLISEMKSGSSVIVKHEVKSPHHLESSKNVAHSPSPKLRTSEMMSHYIPTTSAQQHKATIYEYRSPTQSPHHLQHPHTPSPHHHIEPQNLGKNQSHSNAPHHHRSNQLQSPHQMHQRQSPHMHQQQSSAHQAQAEQVRYSSRSTAEMYQQQQQQQQQQHQPQQQHQQQQQQQQQQHTSVKSNTANQYAYHPSANMGQAHYALPVGSSTSSGSKPKVSSPAPPHIYGKPNAGIGSGMPMQRVQESAQSSTPIPLTKPPLPGSVSPSPYQQVSQYHPPHPHQTMQAQSCPPPPPAHSSRASLESSRAMYERSLYPGGTPGGLTPKPLIHHGTSPPTATAAPSPISRSPHLPHNVQMPLSMHMSPAVQTQPLDLGVSDRSSLNREEHVTSPKRRGTPLNHPQAGPMPLEVKKRKLDSPSGMQQMHPHQQQQLSPQPLSLHIAGNMQPQLARVSEPSPLIASAATTITTVVNTAAYRTPANTIIISQPHQQQQQQHLEQQQQQQHQDVSVTHVTSVSPVTSTASTDSGTTKLTVTAIPNSVTTSAPTSSNTTGSPPIVSTPNSVVSDAPSTPIKVNITPSVVDSEKSNSPGPTKSTNYPVRHLKKAWLQRHTGEDVEDTTGVIGSGSCVTLPIPNVNNSSNQTQTKETTSSPVTSLHNIGSMAINSINKTKNLTPKSNVRKTQVAKDTTLNGHGADSTNKGGGGAAAAAAAAVAAGDDSSSSDQERGRKSPPKRKPPKVKRKKGGGTIKKTPSEDLKKRKVTTSQSVAASESGSDSDKESGSEKDSDSGASTQTTTSGKKTANGGNAGSTQKDKEPRKRGRRPKGSKNDKGEEPRQKKSREEREPSLPQRDPFRKPPVGQLKKTGESFLQDGPCFEVAPKLAKCRECRWTPNQRSKNMPNIFCRFYAFRRLRYTKNGQLAIAGFSDPHKDAAEEDLKLWLPLSDSPPPDLDLEMSRLLLHQVGDHFCDLLVQERDALAEHMSDDKTIAWKRVVQGVREMCDVCETTLFNFHWACGKCGFVVCLDCYKGRKNGTIKIWGEPGKDRDEFSWLQCTNRQPHEQEKLMLTQIIAGDSLVKLGKRAHEFRELWGIPQFCACPLSKESKSINGAGYKDIIKGLIKGELNGVKIENKDDEDDKKPSINGVKDEKKSPLSWLADVALSNEDSKNKDADSSDSDNEKEGNFSTLRELLIRPAHKSNGSRAASPANTISNPNNNGMPKNNKKTRMETLDEVISSVIEDTVHKDDGMNDGKSVELKHFVRRYNWQTKGREPLPIRIMTLTESKILYPNIPHSWLCDGKLLRLTDPTNPGNYRVFQDQWKRGQPVIVSDVSKHLDQNLWHPDAFIRDFGDEKNDLINCMTGKLVPNQPMCKFWEGFEHFSKRLKDERGNPMLLKLKDWPPGEDFAELMPSRFNDLMRVLPLSEYTHRSGRLNLASRLPECFVRPDLGPKMYNAYGSALYPTKGTTNLHLDISDAVNVMVYVGIPKDGDNDEHIKEAFRAIDEAGCDILTRRRVRDKGELPGALWHIYNARDADKIRDLLNKVALEKGERLEPHHDPIHDQSGYLDGPLRERLYKEYGVEGYAIVQCLGDSVFIPAGAPHQVRNLHNCIKVAEDFVSPENVSHCFHLTQEFRELSDTHTNHEDKLQIKNIIYHTVKDSLSVLSNLLKNHAVKTETDDVLLDGCNIKSEKDLSGASSSDSSPSGSPANDDTDSKEAA